MHTIIKNCLKILSYNTLPKILKVLLTKIRRQSRKRKTVNTVVPEPNMQGLYRFFDVGLCRQPPHDAAKWSWSAYL